MGWLLEQITRNFKKVKINNNNNNNLKHVQYTEHSSFIK